MTAQEEADIIAFLQTLTDGCVENSGASVSAA